MSPFQRCLQFLKSRHEEEPLSHEIRRFLNAIEPCLLSIGIDNYMTAGALDPKISKVKSFDMDSQLRIKGNELVEREEGGISRY